MGSGLIGEKIQFFFYFNVFSALNLIFRNSSKLINQIEFYKFEILYIEWKIRMQTNAFCSIRIIIFFIIIIIIIALKYLGFLGWKLSELNQ